MYLLNMLERFFMIKELKYVKKKVLLTINLCQLHIFSFSSSLDYTASMCPLNMFFFAGLHNYNVLEPVLEGRASRLQLGRKQSADTLGGFR